MDREANEKIDVTANWEDYPEFGHYDSLKKRKEILICFKFHIVNQGKPLFIEDRDHNRIIFFAPVEWEDTPLPKPNVYYMEEEEMREYFRYVMD